MVGVSTALHLRRRGLSVVLVDRRGPGEETSHGNAGIIQSEAVEPTPMPRDIVSLSRVALGLTNDVRYSLLNLPEHGTVTLTGWRPKCALWRDDQTCA
jgi:D-amino-acid dehydrogenase